MSALFPVINHLIQQNPEHQQDLSRLSGKTLSLNLAGFGLTGRINHDGFLETADQPADTLITFHQSAIRKILTGQEPGVGDISLEGDLMLGMTVLPILGSLRYYASDDLARIFGDSLAGSISERAANIGQTVKKIGQSIAEQISDFSREPESPVIDAATLSAAAPTEAAGAAGGGKEESWTPSVILDIGCAPSIPSGPCAGTPACSCCWRLPLSP